MPKLFVKTYGCTLNQKDTENVVGNNQTTDDLNEIKSSEYILINTCGVKEQTQTKIINFLKKLKEEKINPKKIIVFGCLVDIDKQALLEVMPDAYYFKVSEKKEIEKIISKPDSNKNKKILSKVIILSNGCLGNCYYCAVKFARGKLESRSKKEILSEIEKELETGHTKEILLTSQDNGCYGLDIGENLISLLKEIIKIKKDFKIRVGMANPQFIKPMLKELIEIYKAEKIYKFLHIPIQAGSNKVLKEMNRHYLIEDAEKIISEFRKEIPDITIATDIIVGYPTENENDFLETLLIIKKIKPDIINISRYGARKNIEANKYKDLPGNTKKERSRITTNLFEEIALENNKKFIGQIKKILVTEKGKNKTMVGRTDEYKSVVIKEKIEIGQKIQVKIKEADKYYLIGEIINPKQK